MGCPDPPLTMPARARQPPGHVRARAVLAAAGEEIRVLESLRPVWAALGDVIVEMQPSAWRFAHVSVERGLRVLEELMNGNDFEAITLPHLSRGDTGAAIATWDPCLVPRLASRSDRDAVLSSSKGGISTSSRLNFEELGVYVRNALADPMAFGWFWEILLTRSCRE